MLQLGIKVIQNKAMYWLVLKKEKYSDLKKKEKKKTFFWQIDGMAFYSRNCMKRGIQVDLEMQVPKIRGFIKAELKNSMP